MTAKKKKQGTNPLMLVGAVALAGGAIAFGPVAHASDIAIGLASGSDPFNITASAYGTGTDVFSGSFGSFNLNIITASNTGGSVLPNLLTSTIQDGTRSSGSGTLWIWVTTIDLTQPYTSGLLSIDTTFTNNSLPAGWNVTEYSFFSGSNTFGGTGTLLGSAYFTGTGTDKTPGQVVALNGPFGITQVYKIEWNGSGVTADTIKTEVPEPGSLGILGLGLSALGALGWSRRRRRKAKQE